MATENPQDCRTFWPHLAAFASGEREPAWEQALRQHLESCPSCWAHVQELTRLVAVMQGMPLVPAPPTLTQQVTELLFQEPEPRPQWMVWMERVSVPGLALGGVVLLGRWVLHIRVGEILTTAGDFVTTLPVADVEGLVSTLITMTIALEAELIIGLCLLLSATLLVLLHTATRTPYAAPSTHLTSRGAS